MALRISQFTLSPSLSDTITVDGQPFDLNASTVKFKMRAVGMLPSGTLKVDAPATVTNPTGGVVRYDWVAADLDTAGTFLGWWEVTLPGAKTQDHPDFLIEVQAHAQHAGNLCEVSEVREFLQKPGGDREQDTIIETLIARASAVIGAYTQREFGDSGTLTRRFSVESGLVDLSPYELRSATLVSLHPESASPETLAATTGYEILPYGASGGTYRLLRVAKQYATTSVFSGDFGHGLIDITGTWGMASIPADVRHACVVTVGLWMHREIQAFTATFNITEDRLERPEALPSAVRAMLTPYRQIGIA